jgi:hypothetical protein
MSAFCTACGEPMVGNFCTKCGTPKNIADTQPTPAPQPAVDQQSQLFAERVRREMREREREEERLAAERRAKALEALALQKQKVREARQERINRLRSSVLRRKLLWFPIFGAALLALSYGVAQSAISISNGPAKKLDELVLAIKGADFDALNDETLFPGAQNDSPAWLKNSFKRDSVQDLEILSITEAGSAATAKVGIRQAGDFFDVSLSSTTKWDGIFQVPSWTVSSLGSNGGRFLPNSTIMNSQKITFLNQGGGKDKTFSARTLSSWDNLHMLPGFYALSVEKYGLSSGGFLDAGYWPKADADGIEEASSIVVTSDLAVTEAVRERADRRAKHLAGRCGSSKCSKLPKYGEFDFDLWSKWDYSKYTYSSFSYKWSVDYCTQESEVAASPTFSKFTYTCSLTANAHLYVKYVYYYGYYSDYYWYDNIYDSKSDTITVSFNLKNYKSGK